MFYTGLPRLEILCSVHDLLKTAIPENVNWKPSSFQHLVLTLMRLKLNSTIQDLAYRFDVSKSTVSFTFLKWIDLMYCRMKFLIVWAEWEQLIATMPMSFRKYFKTKVAVIIDCFEVFVDKPSNIAARSATWSQYKHHNTVKFLFGISPQGVITFISNGWGGRASDKYITEHWTILRLLLPGDTLLADRGFIVEESAAFYCAEVKVPAFTKGKKQLAGIDVESTRRIAAVRIHAEWVIGLLRNKYKILQNTLPLDFLKKNDTEHTTIDKIVTVCAALTNLCDSVVPFEWC